MPLPIYLMSNFPSVRPSLNLQFDSQPTPEDMTSHLASVGATFSRASIGTYTDANGLIQEASAGQARPNYSSAGVHEGLLIEESRTNLVTSSEDFSTNFWTLSSGGTGSKPIVTVNQGIAPDGTASADRIQFDLNAGSSSSDISVLATNSSISVTNGDHAISVYLKSYDGSSYDLTFGSNNADVNLNKITVTSEWQRFDVLHDVTGSTTNFYFGLRNAAGVSGLSDTADILIWGAQIEEGSFPTSYIPTIPTFSSRASTATYFDSSGVLQTASIDVARTDHKYIDGQWVEAGLLLEGASTNLVTNSEDVSGYTNFGSTDTASATTSPDNASNGTKIEGDGSQPQIYLASPAITLPSAGDYTISVFAKAGNEDTIQLFFNGFDISSGGTSYFDLTNGTLNSAVPENARIEDVGNGWYKCSVTATVGASDLTGLLSFRVTPSTSAFLYGSNALANGKNAFVYGFQLEAGSQPTSYIPTSGATADRALDDYTTQTKERSADVCYIDGTAFTDFYNQEQGTFFVFWEGFTDGGVDRWIGVNDTTLDNRIIFAFSATAETIRLYIETNDSAQTSVLTDTNVAQTTPNKYALALAENDVDSYQDGSFVASDAIVSLPAVTRLTLDNGTGSAPFQGYIRKLIYFPRRLSDNELIKLTQ